MHRSDNLITALQMHFYIGIKSLNETGMKHLRILVIIFPVKLDCTKETIYKIDAFFFTWIDFYTYNTTLIPQTCGRPNEMVNFPGLCA